MWGRGVPCGTREPSCDSVLFSLAICIEGHIMAPLLPEGERAVPEEVQWLPELDWIVVYLWKKYRETEGCILYWSEVELHQRTLAENEILNHTPSGTRDNQNNTLSRFLGSRNWFSLRFWLPTHLQMWTDAIWGFVEPGGAWSPLQSVEL